MINIGEYDCIRIGPKEMRVSYRDHIGYVFARTDDSSNFSESFTHARIAKLISEGRVRIDRDWFTENQSKARLRSGVSYFSQIPTEERDYLDFKEQLINSFIKKRAHDKSVKMTDASIKVTLGVIQKEANEEKKERSRCDRIISSRGLPSPRTFRRWLKSYREHGYDVLSLRSGRRFSGNREQRLHPMARKLLVKYAFTYCSESRPTYATVHGYMAAEFTRINEERAVEGLEPLRCPSKSVLRQFIADLNQFEVYASRHGLEAARQEFRIVGTGMDIVRPLQHVQIDEWSVQMHTIIDPLGLGDLFSEEERLALSKERLKICAIIDVATRCIISAIFSRSSEASIAIETLQMAVQDKTHIAQLAGCESDWPMFGALSQISADTGGQFIGKTFRRCCADLKTDYMNAPAGISYLRGHIERIFSSIHVGLMPNFTGRTFSNIVKKGDYESEKRASIFSSQLPNIVTRWIVDIYHHTPHSGLGGNTPYNAWNEKVAEFGINPPPNPDQIREIFGIDVDRQLGPRGIRVNGIHYQSLELQELRRQVGDRVLTVRFDPINLGWISTLVNGRWLTIPATFLDVYRGVSLDEWQQATRDIRRRHAENAKITTSIAHHAILAIRQIAANSEKRVSITEIRPSKEDIDREERKLHLGFEIVDDESDASDGMGSDLLAKGIPVAGASATERPQQIDTASNAASADQNIESPENSNNATELWIED